MLPSISIALFALSLGVAQAPLRVESTASEVSVPAGREPTLDGVVEDAEWADALVLPSSGTGSDDEVVLLAKHSGGKLYLGVRSERPAITSVGVADEAAIRVLHASASLGAVEYRPEGEAWKRATAFEWRCKDPTDSEEARAERREHLEKQGWLATTMKMGRGQAEFVIAAPLVRTSPDGSESATIAMSLFGGSSFCAPKGLGDGLRDQRLQMGTPPDELRFAPAEWMRLSWKPDPAPEKAAPK